MNLSTIFTTEGQRMLQRFTPKLGQRLARLSEIDFDAPVGLGNGEP
jgi:hypothetical protein